MFKNKFFIGIGVTTLLSLFTMCSSFYVIEPGQRGIVVTMGKTPTTFSGEGFGIKVPFFSNLVRVSVRQESGSVTATAYSADLQQINMNLKVIYRIPESSVITIYQQYAGSPFDMLIAPRVNEAVKELTALSSAENIVKNRETIKNTALDNLRKKVGNLLVVEDLIIENVDLSDELERAIEQKMVQEQEASKARFTKEKAVIDAETAVIRADGEARAIKKRGDAIRENPGVVSLMIAEKWNGVSPLVVGGDKGANILLPVNSK